MVTSQDVESQRKKLIMTYTFNRVMFAFFKPQTLSPLLEWLNQSLKGLGMEPAPERSAANVTQSLNYKRIGF